MGFFKKLLDKILGSNTLYYPGCLTKSLLPNIQNNYEEILHQLGIDFIKLTDKEFCCGSPVLRAGMPEAFEKIKQKNIAIFKEHAVGLIITNCPACYSIFKYQYHLEEEGIQVEHITQTMDRLGEKKKKSEITIPEVVYHDPCHLGRIGGVYNAPRDVLQKQGIQVKEIPSHHEKSLCCGGGGGLANNNPELAQAICEQTLQQAHTQGEVLTSPCPMCYFQFKKYAKEIEVKEFSELFIKRS